MTRFIKRYFPFLLFTLFYLVIFYKTFLMGLLPFPSDLLVAFFFPYNTGGWPGFTVYVPHKEFIASDVIRQIFPWRVLAIDIFQNFQIPLWNPYNFSGTPLMANLQTAAFYPLNVIFFFFDRISAWNIYILLQPIMAFGFMYLFIRSLKLHRFAALLGGLGFGFIGYFRVWFELGVVVHSGLWLPLVLFGLTKYFQTSNFRYILLSAFAIGFSLLGGHTQTSVYVLVATASYIFAYFIKTLMQKKKLKPIYLSVFAIIIGFGIACIQIIPTIELLHFSARGDVSSTALFHQYQLPLIALVTFFAPDFFGNPAVNTFWGLDYGAFMGYIGLVPLVFAFVGLFERMKEFHVRFALGLMIFCFLLAMPTPISDLLVQLHVPVLDTGYPSRILFLIQFCLVLLSAYGLDAFIQKHTLKKTPFIFFGGIYVLLIIIVYAAPTLFAHSEFLRHLEVAKRNTLLPSILAFLLIFLVTLAKKFSQTKIIIIILILCIATFDYQYTQYKFLPFAPKAYIFPEHPLISYLQKNTPPDRVYGYGTAQLATNLTTYWHILSPEGYDPLYIRQYGELVYASSNGYSENIMRSDALYKDGEPASDTHPKQVVMNLSGVKYVVDKDDLAYKGIMGKSNKFDKSRYELVWELDKWRVYKNKNALGRAMIFYDWQIKPDNKANITTLFADNFDYQNSLVLATDSPFTPSKSKATMATITKYEPNTVTVSAKAMHDGFVFLSDNYYPGWNAYVDGKKVQIMRADYTFRAVPVTKGIHTVVFKYEPMSFKIGALISALSILISSLLFFILRRKK